MFRRSLWLVAALWACDDGSGQTGEVFDAGADVADVAPLHDAAPPDAITDPDAAPPPEPIVYDAPGPSAVGFRIDEITYEAPGRGARTLRLTAWYPTKEPNDEAGRYATLITRAGVHAEAPPAITADTPVLVFSHGNQGVAEQSWFLTEHFASHGWLVLSPDHTGNTFSDNSEDSYRLFELRPHDISAILDHLESGEHAFGEVTTERVVLSGHSFGGYTTLAVAGAGFRVDDLVGQCATAGQAFCDYIDEAKDRYAEGFLDDRVDVAIPLAPAGATVFVEGLADVEMPVLLVTGARDATLPDAVQGSAIWGLLDGSDDLRVQFTNAGHFSFTSFCEFLGENDGCGEDFTPVSKVHQITVGYALAFARHHLYGDADAAAWLEREPSPLDVYEIERR